MPSNPDPRQTIERKKLQDGSELQLKTWISDVIRPGRRGYQLALVRFSGGLVTQHPIDWENYSMAEVREMYSRIRCVEDFEGLRSKG